MIEFKQIIENARKKVDTRTKQRATRELQGCSEPFRCGQGGHECNAQVYLLAGQWSATDPNRGFKGK